MRFDAGSFAESSWALLIGVSETPNISHLTKLQSPEIDVRSIGKALVDPAGCAIPKEQVLSLVGAAATREAVLEKISHLISIIPDNGSLFLYFAGHGVEFDHQFFLCTADADDQNIRQTAISGNDLDGALSNSKIRGTLAVIDCCKSAGFAEHAPTFFRDFGNSEYRILFASARRHESSHERLDSKGTLFTEGLLKVLRGELSVSSSPNIIYFSELAKAIQLHIDEKLETANADYYQQPVIASAFTRDPILFVHRGLSLESIAVNTKRYSRAYIKNRLIQFGTLVASIVVFSLISAYGILNELEFVQEDGEYLTIYKGHPEFTLPGFPHAIWETEFGSNDLDQKIKRDEATFRLVGSLGQPIYPNLKKLFRPDIQASIAFSAGNDKYARKIVLRIVRRPDRYPLEVQQNSYLLLTEIADPRDFEEIKYLLDHSQSDIRQAALKALIRIQPRFGLSRSLTGLPDSRELNRFAFFPHDDVVRQIEGSCDASIVSYLGEVLNFNSNEPETAEVIDTTLRLGCTITNDQIVKSVEKPQFFGHSELAVYSFIRGVSDEVAGLLIESALENPKSFRAGEIYNALYYFENAPCPDFAIDSLNGDHPYHWLSVALVLDKHCPSVAVEFNWNNSEKSFEISLSRADEVLGSRSIATKSSMGHDLIFIIREIAKQRLVEFEPALHYIVHEVADTPVNEAAFDALVAIGANIAVDSALLDSNALATRHKAIEYERIHREDNIRAQLVSRIGGRDGFYVEMLGRIGLDNSTRKALDLMLEGSVEQRRQASCVLAMQDDVQKVVNLLTHWRASIRISARRCASYNSGIVQIIEALPNSKVIGEIGAKRYLSKQLARKRGLQSELMHLPPEWQKARLDLINNQPWGLWDFGTRSWINELRYQLLRNPDKTNTEI